MNSSVSFDQVNHARPMRWFMIAAWVVILLKCGIVFWAVRTWNVPVYPAWIVVPTLSIAAVATWLWISRSDEE